MIGLLAKAKQLRGGREEIAYDPESGISREDQKELLQEIDRLATQNRIKITPEVFTVHAVKRGILFPLVVIGAALLASGLGVLTFYLLFQQGETQLSQEQGASITAEGKLIEQVKKESAARLDEKNQQIAQIQSRLAEIDKERKDLQFAMDTKVGQKEQELRASLAQELEAERAKLQKQGLSDQAIAKRLQDLEAQKNAEFARQLDVFRQQAEAERVKAEQNLKSLESEFNANLAKANTERQQVLTDSRKREDELRGQLEQNTQVLETEKAQTKQAQQALSSLASQREREDLISGQLIGLYAVARSDIAQRDYLKALQSLKAVADFVNSQDVSTLPTIARRHDFDMFVVDSLTSLVQGEIDKGNTDTSSLVASAGQITEIRNRVGEADALFKSGKIAEAETAYEQALQLVPEIGRAYAYFIKRDRDTEAARQARLRDQLAKAQTAFEAGRLSEATAAYRDAFAYLPETPERIDRILSNVAAAGSDAEAQKSRQVQARAAAGVLAQARSLQGQGNLDDALPLYLQIISRYPQSPQVEGAAQGIQSTVKAMNERADADRKKAEAGLTAQITSLQADLEKARRQLAEANARQTAAGANQTGTATNQTAAAAKQTAAGANQTAQVANQTSPTTGASGLTAPDAQTLKDLQARFAALDQAYKSYTSREDPVLSSKGDRALVDTKTYLDSFLGSKSVESAFPGIFGRIKRYDEGFQAAGRSDALQDALDVVIQLSRQKAPDKRQKILDDKMKSFRKDSDMTGFLQQLQALVK